MIMYFANVIIERFWPPPSGGPKEIDVLLVSSGKASMLLTGHLITG